MQDVKCGSGDAAKSTVQRAGMRKPEGCPVCRVVSSLTWPLRSIFLSGIDLTPQSAVASDAATALEAESVLRPLYMDVQATTPLVRMEGQLSLSCLVELYCRSGNAQKWLNPCRSESH